MNLEGIVRQRTGLYKVLHMPSMLRLHHITRLDSALWLQEDDKCRENRQPCLCVSRNSTILPGEQLESLRAALMYKTSSIFDGPDIQPCKSSTLGDLTHKGIESKAPMTETMFLSTLGVSAVRYEIIQLSHPSIS